MHRVVVGRLIKPDDMIKAMYVSEGLRRPVTQFFGRQKEGSAQLSKIIKLKPSKMVVPKVFAFSNI